MGLQEFLNYCRKNQPLNESEIEDRKLRGLSRLLRDQPHRITMRETPSEIFRDIPLESEKKYNVAHLVVFTEENSVYVCRIGYSSQTTCNETKLTGLQRQIKENFGISPIRIFASICRSQTPRKKFYV